MAIVERDIAGGWERKATGEDIPKLMGSLVQTGNEAYKKAFEKNHETGFQRMVNPQGAETWIRKDDIQQALDTGYTSTGSIRMMMPEMPWKQNRLGPGKWKYRKNEAGAYEWVRG